VSEQAVITSPAESTGLYARPGAPIRMALLALTVAVTSVAGVALSVLYPETDADDRFSYAVVEPAREHFWIWHIVGPVNLIVGVCAIAVAGLVLTPARGAAVATVGGAMMWLGAALYGTGIGGLGPIYYFGTEQAALDREAAIRFLDYLNDEAFWRLWGAALAGGVLVTLGTVVLSVALWRGRTVPRWVPLVAAVSIVATFFVAGTGTVPELTVDAAVAVSSTAIGWYAWRSSRPPSA
jgi:hypothetical protein